MHTSDILVKYIEALGLRDAKFQFISHEVFQNWRVMNPNVQKKLLNLREGLVQHEPIKIYCRSGSDVLGNRHLHLGNKNHGFSICSAFKNEGRIYHIPMMNLHIEFTRDVEQIAEIITTVTRSKEVCILNSGRFFHAYFLDVLSADEWRKFLASFLMPSIIVSPRYIGHSLYRGYCTLRITPCGELKPQNPEVVWSNWQIAD